MRVPEFMRVEMAGADRPDVWRAGRCRRVGEDRSFSCVRSRERHRKVAGAVRWLRPKRAAIAGWIEGIQEGIDSRVAARIGAVRTAIKANAQLPPRLALRSTGAVKVQHVFRFAIG